MNSLLSLLAGTLLLLQLLGARSAQAQALTFDRAVVCASGGGSYGWGPTKMVVDAQGDTYVAGTFNGTIAIGSSILVATQTNPASTLSSDIFIAKLNAQGNYLWAVQLGDNQAAVPGDLVVDAGGNVYLTGVFYSYSMQFGVGGPTLFNSSAGTEAFVAKLDGTTHQWQWARRAGGIGNDSFLSIALNAAGEVYLAGNAGSQVADFGPFTLAGSPAGGFLARISSTGTWLGVQQLGGNGRAGASTLLFDAQGNLYLAGGFIGPSVTFGATTLTTLGVPGSFYAANGRDLFVARLNANGTWAWAVQGDAMTRQNLTNAATMASDGNGQLYIAGNYANTAVRIGTTVLPNLSIMPPLPTPPPPNPLTNDYPTDIYVARLDATTGAWGWAVRNGGPSGENIYKMVVDTQGSVYVLGSVNVTLPIVGTNIAQLGQLNRNTGAWGSIQSLGAFAQDMAMDGQRQLHLAGNFSTPTVSFGPATLAQAGPGQDTGFVAWMAAGPLATHPATMPAAHLTVWPNPSTQDVAWVQGPPAGEPVAVFDVLGRLARQGRMPATGPFPLKLAALPVGLYSVRSAGQAQRLVVER